MVDIGVVAHEGIPCASCRGVRCTFKTQAKRRLLAPVAQRKLRADDASTQTSAIDAVEQGSAQAAAAPEVARLPSHPAITKATSVSNAAPPADPEPSTTDLDPSCSTEELLAALFGSPPSQDISSDPPVDTTCSSSPTMSTHHTPSHAQTSPWGITTSESSDHHSPSDHTVMSIPKRLPSRSPLKYSKTMDKVALPSRPSPYARPVDGHGAGRTAKYLNLIAAPRRSSRTHMDIRALLAGTSHQPRLEDIVRLNAPHRLRPDEPSSGRDRAPSASWSNSSSDEATVTTPYASPIIGQDTSSSLASDQAPCELSGSSVPPLELCLPPASLMPYVTQPTGAHLYDLTAPMADTSVAPYLSLDHPTPQPSADAHFVPPSAPFLRLVEGSELTADGLALCHPSNACVNCATKLEACVVATSLRDGQLPPCLCCQATGLECSYVFMEGGLVYLSPAVMQGDQATWVPESFSFKLEDGLNEF